MGQQHAVRVSGAALGAVLLAGCGVPVPGPTPPSTPTPSASPSADPGLPEIVVPPSSLDEVARDSWSAGVRDTRPGTLARGAERWVVQGGCEGGADLAVTYTVEVDGHATDGGTLVCSTGLTYVNTALGTVPVGRHAVTVRLGDEVAATRVAYVRLLPESAL